MKKTLTILRHAKAETGSAGQEDQTRTLTARGIEATRFIGSYLIERGITPGKVLCSTAIRTTETWLKIEHLYPHPLPVEYHPKLYLASANEMLNIIGAVEDEVQSLLVVAHNPGIHELAMKLAKEGSEQLIDKMALKFPTCAVATFACDAKHWKNLSDSKTELVGFTSPKMLGQEII